MTRLSAEVQLTRNLFSVRTVLKSVDSVLPDKLMLVKVGYTRINHTFL